MKKPSKSRPDYTKYMRKPAPLELSPPTVRDESPRVFHPDIPWAEIIIDEDLDLYRAPWRQESAPIPELVPPIPVLMGLAVIVAFLIWQPTALNRSDFMPFRPLRPLSRTSFPNMRSKPPIGQADLDTDGISC